MTRPFELSLARLENVAVAVTANDVPDEEGSAAIVVKFSDDTVPEVLLLAANRERTREIKQLRPSEEIRPTCTNPREGKDIRFTGRKNLSQRAL